MSLDVQLDVRELVERLDHATKEVTNALRRSVDRAARAARKDAVEEMARDANVRKSAFKSAVPTVKGTTANSLSATFTISRKRILISLTGGVRLPVRGSHGLAASTFVDTGGRSSHLFAPKAFSISAGGQVLVMRRTGKGRAAMKPFYAAMPSTMMAQEDGTPRKFWSKVASRDLDANVRMELQKVLSGGMPSAAQADGSE